MMLLIIRYLVFYLFSFRYVSNDALVQYTNWNKNSFINKSENDCVISDGQSWKNFDCNCGDSIKVICSEKEIPSCPDEQGWQIIKGRCFYFGPSEIFYFEAENDCTDNRGKILLN